MNQPDPEPIPAQAGAEFVAEQVEESRLGQPRCSGELTRRDRGRRVLADSAGRGGDAGIDASLRRGHRQIDPVRGAFVVARDELQSLFVHVADTHTTVPFTELVSAGVAAIRRRLQIAGDQACAVTAQLVRQPRRDQHAARGRSSAGVAFAVILASLPQLERRLPWRSR